MKKIKIALVGRPNVGKSALFNRICQRRIAIVDEREGVTRDRLYAPCDLFGQPFLLIDTGGIDPSLSLPFAQEVMIQAEVAIEEADSLIMVVDGQVGPLPLDYGVARLLQQSRKPLVLAINKMDGEGVEGTFPFYRLGISRMVAVSATQGTHIAELLTDALAPFAHPPGDEESANEESPKGPTIALVGRPNVGKSTLLNTLFGQERAIVSPIPGTTRDAIDVVVGWEENEVTFIDTAGVRRKRAEGEPVDKFASLRTEQAIQRSSLCLLLFGCARGVDNPRKKDPCLYRSRRQGVYSFFLINGTL